jgi:hypothetical protein
MRRYLVTCEVSEAVALFLCSQDRGEKFGLCFVAPLKQF